MGTIRPGLTYPTLMTSVVAIEFCADHFKSEKECKDWLQNSEYAELLRVTKFRLKTNAQAQILTNERKRPVWKWSQGLGSHTRVDIVRPVSTVVVANAAGPRFTPVELPTPLPSNVQREEEKKARHAERVAFARAQREEKARLNPPKPKKRKAPKTETTKKRTKKNNGKTKTEEDSGVGIVLPQHD